MTRKITQRFIIDYLFILLVLLSLIISIYLSCVLNDWLWFSRSGSLVVLFALVLEYRNFGFIGNEDAKTEAGSIRYSSIDRHAAVEIDHKIRCYFPLIAHFFIVIGTLIWGYGDLISHLLQKF